MVGASRQEALGGGVRAAEGPGGRRTVGSPGSHAGSLRGGERKDPGRGARRKGHRGSGSGPRFRFLDRAFLRRDRRIQRRSPPGPEQDREGPEGGAGTVLDVHVWNDSPGTSGRTSIHVGRGPARRRRPRHGLRVRGNEGPHRPRRQAPRRRRARRPAVAGRLTLHGRTGKGVRRPTKVEAPAVPCPGLPGASGLPSSPPPVPRLSPPRSR